MIIHLKYFWQCFLHWLDPKWEKPEPPSKPEPPPPPPPPPKPKPPPKEDYPFFYGQRLKVIKGFYRGCIAVITRLDDDGKYHFYLYNKDSQAIGGQGCSYSIDREARGILEPIKEEEEKPIRRGVNYGYAKHFTSEPPTEPVYLTEEIENPTEVDVNLREGTMKEYPHTSACESTETTATSGIADIKKPRKRKRRTPAKK